MEKNPRLRPRYLSLQEQSDIPGKLGLRAGSSQSIITEQCTVTAMYHSFRAKELNSPLSVHLTMLLMGTSDAFISCA